MTTPFQRARSDAQREARRDGIRSTARAMLARRRVAELSLNELARETGLAKSNVLRYFESREAILLDIYDAEYTAWLDALESELARGHVRDVEGLAAAIARTAAARPVFCDLCSASADVLERNVSGDVAAAYKLAAMAQAVRLGALVGAAVPALADATIGIAAAVNLGIGGIWALTRPSPGMAEAYRRHPELRVYGIGFEPALREFIATTLTGLIHRMPQVPSEAARLPASTPSRSPHGNSATDADTPPDATPGPH